MPNIVMVGVEDHHVQERIQKILLSMEEGISTDSVITVIPGSSCTEIVKGNKAPYLIVRDTNNTRGAKIATVLSRIINIDVEQEVLAGFYPRVK
ncbi:MAG: hypothetical protein PHN69_02145 [Candidatus Pacebacteria bacterium]|nr:hypothetical protein [Candidatus Paceibacterota bacterium]